MRSEYITYASFTPEQRDAIVLPPLDATQEQLDFFWMETALLNTDPDSKPLLVPATLTEGGL